MDDNVDVDVELIQLRHRISDGIKGDLKMLDHRCIHCGCGIDKGSEVFIVTPDYIVIWCAACFYNCS